MGTLALTLTLTVTVTVTLTLALTPTLTLGKSSCSIRPCGITGDPCPFHQAKDPCSGHVKKLAVQASGCKPVPSPVTESVIEPDHATAAAPTQRCYRVKMSKLFNGWVDVASLPAQPGTVVTLEYSGHADTPSEWHAVDTVVIGAGKGGTGFSNRFNWHEFQYVTVSGHLDSAPALKAFSGRRLMNAMPRTGSFMSTDPMLNKVYSGFRETNEGLTISGMLVDCPNRERLGYGGDAHSHIEFVMYTYASAPFFRKWLRDWADTTGQAPQGSHKVAPPVVDEPAANLPNTAPTFDGAGGPMWGGISVVLPHELYTVTGDIRMLRAAYPTAAAFVNFMWRFSGNGTTLLKPNGFDFLGDWQTPHG